MLLRRVLPLAAILLTALPGAAAADDAVGVSVHGTSITADAGYTAWRSDHG